MLAKVKKAIKIHYVFLLIILALSALHGYNMFERQATFGDEGIFLRAAAEVNEGNWLYIGGSYRPIHTAAVTAMMFVFGYHDWSGVLVSFVFGMASLALVYIMALELFNKKGMLIGNLAAMSMGLTVYFAYYTKSMRSESMFLFFFLLVLLLYVFALKRKQFSWYMWIFLILMACGIQWIRFTGIFVTAVILLHEGYLWLTRKDKKHIFMRAAALGITVVFFYGLTYTIYTVFSPDPSGDDMGTNIDVYNQNSLYRILNLFFVPLEGFNPFYYAVVLWNWAIPGFAIVALIGVILLFYHYLHNKIKNPILILLFWIGFFYLFLTFFPAHRVKIFYPIIPALCLCGAYALANIKMRSLQILTVLLIILVGFFTVVPTVTYTPQQNMQVAQIILDDAKQNGNEVNIITSNLITYWWFLEFSEDVQNKVDIEYENIHNLIDIEDIQEFRTLYQQGFTYAILDQEDCFDLKVADDLQQITPLAVLPNQVATQDPLIKNDYQQQPFLAPSDVRRHRQGTCNQSNPYYQNIFIYKVQDIITHLDKRQSEQ